jgi:DNA polymerase IV
VIAHLDIDAFYASVELLRRPELRGKPLVISGLGPRAVVTTASYEARRFGIDSAMPAVRARALCPQAVFLPPDFDAYRRASGELWALVRARLPHVQQVGIDEAYVDLSVVEKPLRALRELVAEIAASSGLVVSVGVGPSRLVAKTASAAFKPAAFVALSREDACTRFAGASARVLQGVGPKTAERLAELGIHTVGELQVHPAQALQERFGARLGAALKARAHFHDDSPVENARIAKSRSCETTFETDVGELALLETHLARLCEQLCRGLRSRGRRGRTIGIKVRLDDWNTVTRARSLPAHTDDAETVGAVALELLRDYAPTRPVRLLGVRIASFDDEAPAPPAAEESRQLVLLVA